MMCTQGRRNHSKWGNISLSLLVRSVVILYLVPPFFVPSQKCGGRTNVLLRKKNVYADGVKGLPPTFKIVSKSKFPSVHREGQCISFLDRIGGGDANKCLRDVLQISLRPHVLICSFHFS